MVRHTTFRISLGLLLCGAATPGLSAMQSIDRVTCDGSACPRPLELEDGRAVTITLAGQRLDALSAGEVIDGRGRPVGEVTVEVLPLSRAGRARVTRGTSTRDVTVTFARGPARSGLRLRLTTSRGRPVVAPLELATAPALADLTIPFMRVGWTGTGFLVEVHVRNIGVVTAPPVAALIRCEVDGGADPIDDYQYHFGTAALPPGERGFHDVDIPASSLTPESERLECTVDPLDNASESDETNNTRAVLLDGTM